MGRFNFSGFSRDNFFIIGLLSFLLIWAMSKFLEWTGLISSSVSLGLGITVISIFLAIIAVYMVVVNRKLSLNRSDLLVTLLVFAFLIGIVFVLPGVLPQIYSIGAEQLQSAVGVGVQSIFG